MKHFKGKSKQFIFFWLCLTALCAILIGIFIRPQELKPISDLGQFNYQYVDIHKKFFKKMRKGKDVLYIAQRQNSNAKDFPSVKKSSTIRIFLIGGSVAYNFGFYNLENDLKAFVPNRDFEIISCGMGAYDSYRDFLVEKEILFYKPDLIIVFSGNNEFYGKAKFNLTCYRLNNFFKRFRVYRMAQEYILRSFIRNNAIYYKNSSERIENYKKNMQIIARTAKLKRVPIILCTLPVNFRDCPPQDPPPTDKEYLLAKFLLIKKDYKNAIVLFKKFVEDNPDSAFGYYFLARAYEGINDYSKAKENYLKSLELDFGGGGRASSKSNDIVRTICREEKLGLADLEVEFIKLAPDGLLGRDQFSDECHWHMDYNPLVAAVIIKTFFQYYPESSVIEASNYKSGLFSTLNKFRPMSLEERGARKDLVEDIVKKSVWKAMNTDNYLSERAVSEFEMLYLMNPNVFLHVKLFKDKIKSDFYEDFWTKEYICDFEKRWAKVLCHIGEAYWRNGMYQEALGVFNEAIALDKNLSSAYLGNALVYQAMGNNKKAKENIVEAEKVSDNLSIKYYKAIFGF